MSKTLTFDCKMSCSGCSSAIERIITKNKDKLHIINYSISLEKQEVIVEYDNEAGDVTDAIILDKLKKSGKEISLRQ
ncbi:hypothetical protein ACO0SA_002528 [Hanseniaspora valbyensis]|uniref:HMA domain-containing protein n=1 Tax=Hanseniaspora valbyensis NRRL Y-1626 TaxID=766949 RepID=A0A1B7TAP4_9ASCO|nr:hypothetical protein HANVADRAFT_59940 [Hanseniaspora valbyensis NRRL Y-1626]